MLHDASARVRPTAPPPEQARATWRDERHEQRGGGAAVARLAAVGEPDALAEEVHVKVSVCGLTTAPSARFGRYLHRWWSEPWRADRGAAEDNWPLRMRSGPAGSHSGASSACAAHIGNRRTKLASEQRTSSQSQGAHGSRMQHSKRARVAALRAVAEAAAVREVADGAAQALLRPQMARGPRRIRQRVDRLVVDGIGHVVGTAEPA